MFSAPPPHPLLDSRHPSSSSEVFLTSASIGKIHDSNVLRARGAVRMNQYPLPLSTIKALITELKGKHILSGVSSLAPGGTPFVLMTAADIAGFKACRRKPSLAVWWQCADTPYGKIFRLSVGPELPVAHALFPVQSAPYAAFIKTGRICFATSHAGQVTEAYVVDFADDPLRRAALRQDGDAPHHSDFLFEDTDLAYWWLATRSGADWSELILRRAQDTLHTDWVNWATLRAQRFVISLSEIKSQFSGRPTAAAYRDQNFPAKYPHFYRLLEAVYAGASTGALLALAGQSLQSADVAHDMLLASVVASQWRDNLPTRVAMRALRLSWHVHPAVHAGRRRPWFDRHGEHIIPRFIDLDPVSLGRNARNYWRDVDLHFPIDHGTFFNDTDLPADIAACKRMLNKLPLAATTHTDTAALIESLLAEAREHKQWTVPPMGARVELGIATFPYVDLYEIGSRYWCVLRDPSNRYFLAMADLDDGIIDIPDSIVANDTSTDTTNADRALGIILASIIRDFVVTDRRELVFGERRSKRKTSRGKPTGEQFPAYTYLPRVSFGSTGSLASAKADFAEFQPRARHSVSGHLRRCDNPSVEQRILAQRDGVSLFPGTTYVRPHFRGEKEREQVRRNFRSRSVCQMLFPAVEARPTSTTEWFDFERKAHRFVAALKLTIGTVSTASSSSQSVDICAFDHRRNLLWLIRFMLLPAHRYVSADAIRNMVGKLEQNPGDVKAMIVTTSGFTAKAIVDARACGVRLVDGAEFSAATAGA